MQGWKEIMTEGRMDYDCQVLLLSTTTLYHYVSTTYILRVSTKPPLSPHRPWTCVARGLLACRPQLDTPYTRLPTVQDFMEVKREGGVTTILEKKMDSVTEASFRSHGRQRKLHPQQTLKQLHDPVDESHYPQGVTYADPDEKPLLRVNRLKVHFPIRRGLLLRTHGYVKAVDDISFDVYRGQTLGLVGESGCGKTTTGRAILQLIAPTAGTIHLEDQELTQISASEIRLIRQKMQIIFQDPYGSLNPRMTLEIRVVRVRNFKL